MEPEGEITVETYSSDCAFWLQLCDGTTGTDELLPKLVGYLDAQYESPEIRQRAYDMARITISWWFPVRWRLVEEELVSDLPGIGVEFSQATFRALFDELSSCTQIDTERVIRRARQYLAEG